MHRKNNPARAGRSEYRSREVREIRDGGPYYTVKSEWLTHPPTLTEGHFDLPEVREATVVAEHGREHGASLGRGNFGLTYLTQTVHGPVVVKVAATEALYGNRQRWSRVDQQNNMMHEAGVANELADMGYDVVPRTTYVELADGTPALVREYGDLADSVTPDEFYALETRLLALEKATGWRVQDDLLVLRRPDGSLFIGDVGIWQPPSARNGKTRVYDPLDSSLGSLLSKFAEAAFGQRDISSLPRIAHLMEGLSNMDEDSFFVKVLREQMQEALASREAVGIPSPPGALAFAEDVRENPYEARENPEPKEDVVILRGRRVLVEKQATKVYARLDGWSSTPHRYGKKKDFVVVLDESEDAGTLRSRVLTDPHPTRKAALAEAERTLELLEEVDKEKQRENPASLVTAGSLGLKKIHNDLYRSPDERFSIVRVFHHHDGSEWWYWRDEVKNEGGDDLFKRKWEVVEALEDYMKHGLREDFDQDQDED